jgi:hypothetical protein
MIKIAMLLLSIVMLYSAYASECDPPGWIQNPPLIEKSCYWIGRGSGSTIEAATSAAWSHVFSQLAMSNVASIQATMDVVQRETNGELTDSVINHIRAEGALSSDGRQLFKVMQTEQTPSTCDGKYHYYLLLCVPASGCKCTQIIPSTTGAVLRSVVLPGWGQMYKGRPRKGVAFLSTAAIFAGSSFVFSMLSAQNDARAENARTADVRSYYTSWRDGTYYASIGFGIAAGGIYVLNVFNAKNLRAVPTFK